MKKTLLISSAGTAVLFAFLINPGVEAKPDAVSAASLVVRVASVSSTGAVIEYSQDRYDYGTRVLCYDPAPAVARNNCIRKTAQGRSGSFTISNLKTGTLYNFRIEAISTWSGHSRYNTKGTFTTSVPVGMVGVDREPAIIPGLESEFDVSGRRMPKDKTGNRIRVSTSPR